MKKKILFGFLMIVMCFYLVGCGNDTTQSKQESNESGETNSSTIVEITDSAKTVAEKFNVKYNEMGVEYYFVDGYVDSPNAYIRLYLKNAKEKTERQKDIISLIEYFKNISDDGKIYSNKEMNKEFDNVVILDTTYFMSIYFNINGTGYKTTITQKDSMKYQNNQYYGYDIYLVDLSY